MANTTEPFAGIDELRTDAAPSMPEGTGNVRMDGWLSFLSGIGTSAFDKVQSGEFVCEPVGEGEARDIFRGDSWGARAAEIRPREMLRTGWKLCIADADPGESTPDLPDLGNKVPQANPSNTPFLMPVRTDASTPKKLARYINRRMKQRNAGIRLDAAALETKKLVKRVEQKARKLHLNKKIKECMVWENAYGGSVMLIGAQDGATDWKLPLDLSKINSPDKVTFITPLEARCCEPIAYYSDPKAEKFGEIAIWRITPTAAVAQSGVPLNGLDTMQAVDIHESRLLVFPGIKISRVQAVGVRAGFGDSIYTRLKPVLRRFGLGWGSAAIIINEFSLAVMKIKGLADMVGTDNQKKILARMAANQLARSIARCTLVDKDGEDFSRDTASVAGLSDLLEKIMQELAGACDCPVTVFMGMSPAGLNATGESDIRGWYDRLASEWLDKVEPPLAYLLKIIIRSENKGKEPENWSVEAKPWWQEAPKEKAETAFLYAQTDEKNIANQVYSSEEARTSRYGGESFGTDIIIDSDDETPDDDELLASDPAYAAAQQAGGTPMPGAVPVPGMPVPNPGMKPGVGPANAPNMQAAQPKPIDSSKVLEIVEAVTGNDIPRESGLAILKLVFGVSDEQANAILGPVGFEAPTPPPPPAPFGGGAKPPIAPPNGAKPADSGAKPAPAKEPTP